MKQTEAKAVPKSSLFNTSASLAENQSSCHLTVETSQVVNCVEFSHIQSSYYLLAFESNSRVSVIKLLVEEQRDDISFDYELIQEFVIGLKCSSISFSPQTNLDSVDKCLKLSIATNDFDIRIVSSNLKPNEDSVDYLYLKEHCDFINDIAFSPSNGNCLASVSDDCSCCLWSIDDKSVQLSAKLTLTSPGVSVKWHSSESEKLLIAEKKGVIRFYNTEYWRPIMSFDCNLFPLLSADWAPNNSLFIGCVSGSQILFWDTSLSSQPIERRKGHIQGSQMFKFFNNYFIATRGRPNNTVQVINLKTNQILLDQPMKAGSGISFNCKLPILAVGAIKAIHLYRFHSV